VYYIEKEFELMVAACKEKKTIAVLVIGEEERFQPEFYSKMAKDPTSRENFVSSVMELVNKYGLGGLLIDWQSPVYWWVSQIQKYFYLAPAII
jgi:GH18 family chitinase